MFVDIQTLQHLNGSCKKQVFSSYPKSARFRIAVSCKPSRKKPKQNMALVPKKQFFSPNDDSGSLKWLKNGFLVYQARIQRESDSLFLPSLPKQWAYLGEQFRFGVWLHDLGVCRILQLITLAKSKDSGFFPALQCFPLKRFRISAMF